MYFAGPIFNPEDAIWIYGSIPATLLGIFIAMRLMKRLNIHSTLARGLFIWMVIFVIIAILALITVAVGDSH